MLPLDARLLTTLAYGTPRFLWRCIRHKLQAEGALALAASKSSTNAAMAADRMAPSAYSSWPARANADGKSGPHLGCL